MARIEIDSDIGRRLMRDDDVQAEVERRARKIHAASVRLVHVDPEHDFAKEGPHLRDTIFVRRVGNTWHIGSNKRYALTEEFSESPRYGGVHSYLRAAIHAGRD